MIVDHPPRRVVRRGAAFRIEARGATELEAVPEAEHWRIEGLADAPTCRLERSPRTGVGFVLRGTTADQDAPTSLRMDGLGSVSDLRYLLMDDGRLFRIVFVGPREGRYELVGWETPGAYLTALPESDGWRIEPTPACSGIPEIRTITLLFAAEILDSEAPLVPREPAGR